MLRLGLVAVVAIFVSSVLLLSMVRGMGYNDGHYAEMRRFLLSTDICDGVPCFMGLTPQMDYRDALQILNEQPAIERTNLVDYQVQLVYIDWYWTGTEPDFISDIGTVYLERERVERVELTTDLRLGDIWALLGAPDLIHGNTVITARYPAYGFYLRFALNCDSPLQSAVTIHYAEQNRLALIEADTLNNLIQQSCNQQFP